MYEYTGYYTSPVSIDIYQHSPGVFTQKHYSGPNMSGTVTITTISNLYFTGYSNNYSTYLIYGYIKEFRQSSCKVMYGYYVLFVIRRFIFVISFHLIKENPYIQVSTVSMSCWVIVVYLAIYKPYLEMNTNIIQVLVEMCVSVAYTSNVILLNEDVNREFVGWIVFISVNLSYIIQLLPILLNAYKKIHARIRNKRDQIDIHTEKKVNETSINILPDSGKQVEHKDGFGLRGVESGFFSRVKL